MKNNKINSAFLISALIISACGKENAPIANNEIKSVENLKTIPKSWELWEQYIQGPKANLALSEFLAKGVMKENIGFVQKNVMPLSLDEIQSLITQIEVNSKSSKKDLIFYESHLKNDDNFLNSSLFSSTGNASALSFEQQFTLKSTAKIKTDLLKNILSIYDKQINENTDLIAENVIKEINDHSPELKNEMETAAQKGDFKKLKDLALKASPVVSKLDTLFKTSGLNAEEQVTTMAFGIVGFKIYEKIKEKKTFKEILKTYQEVKEITSKAREVKALLSGINDYQKEMKSDWKELTDSMKGLAHDSSELFNKSKKSDLNVDGKKISKFLFDSLIKGEAKINENEPSVLSKQIAINKNLETAIKSADKLTTNFGTILKSTEAIAKILHIELPKDVKKAIDTAKKANAIFSLASKTMQGLKGGGIMGAISVLSSDPAMDMLGLNADPDAAFKGEVLAQLGVINQKLDEVIDLQKQTIKIQLETMNMIKELAIMVDEYHRREMDLMSEIKDVALTNLEISKVALNDNVRSCEIIYNYQLNNITGLVPYKLISYEDMNALDVDIQKFKSTLSSQKEVAHMIGSAGFSGWEKCQNGLHQVFGLSNVFENPIRGIFSSGENENLLKFQREIYYPLLHIIKVYKKDSVLLHLPVKDLKALTQKNIYMLGEVSQFTHIGLDDFISTRALERNTTQLLIFFPFLDLSVNDWSGTMDNVLRQSINNSELNKFSRSYFLLRNSLSLIQTAIAQESLLSGEPILDVLSKNTDQVLKDENLTRAVFSNKLLMKNFLKYEINNSLTQNDLSKLTYADALKNKDLAKIEEFLNNQSLSPLLSFGEDGLPVLQVKMNNGISTIPFPTAEELDDLSIEYSANTYKLIELEKRVLDAIAKVAPNNFNGKQKANFSNFLIYQ